MKATILSSLLLPQVFSKNLTCGVSATFFYPPTSESRLINQCFLTNPKFTKDLQITNTHGSDKEETTTILPNTIFSIYRSPLEIQEQKDNNIYEDKPLSQSSKKFTPDKTKKQLERYHLTASDIIHFQKDTLAYHSTTHYFSHDVFAITLTICTPLRCLSYTDSNSFTFDLCSNKEDTSNPCECESPHPIDYDHTLTYTIAMCVKPSLKEEIDKTIQHSLFYISLTPLSSLAKYDYSPDSFKCDPSSPSCFSLHSLKIALTPNTIHNYYLYNLTSEVPKNGLFSISHNLFSTNQLPGSLFAVRTERDLYLFKKNAKDDSLVLSKAEEALWSFNVQDEKKEEESKEGMGRRIIIQIFSDHAAAAFFWRDREGVALYGQLNNDFLLTDEEVNTHFTGAPLLGELNSPIDLRINYHYLNDAERLMEIHERDLNRLLKQKKNDANGNPLDSSSKKDVDEEDKVPRNIFITLRLLINYRVELEVEREILKAWRVGDVSLEEVKKAWENAKERTIEALTQWLEDWEAKLKEKAAPVSARKMLEKLFNLQNWEEWYTKYYERSKAAWNSKSALYNWRVYEENKLNEREKEGSLMNKILGGSLPIGKIVMLVIAVLAVGGAVVFWIKNKKEKKGEELLNDNQQQTV